MTTIDLELAKELQEVCKEKSITMPESDKDWVKYADERYIEYNEPFVIQHAVVDEDYEYLAPAFLLCELMEWLPKSIEFITNIKYIKSLQWDNINNTWSAGYMNYEDWHCYQNDPNPANAACKLLIWLIKEGLI